MSLARVVIGITGGVAAYKAAALVSMLAKGDYEVTVVMTESATKFVGTATLMALSGRPVVTGMFDPAFPLGPHIEVARRADLLCIAPATADFMGKAAHGLADDLLSTLYLAFTKPIIMAPAMNREMWAKPVVQRNVEILKQDGVQMVGPGEGWLSCRDIGTGRMSEPEEIFHGISTTLADAGSGGVA
ncbi:MAG: flavoprotein [Pirellulaceae bacterium]